MTAGNTGFPDYSRLSPQGGRFLGELQGVINTNPSTPAISTAGFQYVTLTTNGGTAGTDYQVVINWGDGSDPAVRFSSVFYTPASGDGNTVQFPVISEWFTVEYLYIRGSGIQQPTTYIYGTNAPQVVPLLGTNGSASIVQNATINAGNNTTFSSTGIHQGKAKLAFATNGTNAYFLDVNQYSAISGTWQNEYIMAGTQFGTYWVAEIALLPAPVEVVVNNASAANSQYFVTLIPV